MVSSEAHAITPFKERSESKLLEAFNDPAKFYATTRYLSSKLLNLLWTLSLSQKVDPRKVSVVLVSPGFCKSELFREIDGWCAIAVISWCFARTTEAGARMLVRASAVEPWQEAHGAYYSQGMKAP
jgi:retinol dehydrogenase 12